MRLQTINSQRIGLRAMGARDRAAVIQRYFTETLSVESSRIDLTTPLPIGTEVSMYVYPTAGNTGLPSDAPAVTNSIFQTITFTLTAEMSSIFYNDVDYFDGVIANVKANGGALLDMPINEDGSTVLVVDYSGNGNSGTRVNMTAANADLYTQDGADWVQDELWILPPYVFTGSETNGAILQSQSSFFELNQKYRIQVIAAGSNPGDTAGVNSSTRFLTASVGDSVYANKIGVTTDFFVPAISTLARTQVQGTAPFSGSVGLSIRKALRGA